MAKHIWPAEVRDRALELYAEVGGAEASRQTGVPVGTIKAWGHRAKVQPVQVDEVVAATQAAVATRRRTAEERRTALADKAGSAAEMAADHLLQLLAAVPVNWTAVRAATGTLARLVPQHELLTGGATSRPDLSSLSPEEHAARVATKFDELAERRRRVEAEKAAAEAAGESA